MKNATSISATELFEQAEISAAAPKRKLVLKFIGRERPQLDFAEFHCDGAAKPGYWKQKADDGDHSFTWREVAWAVSLFFLDYVSAGLQGADERFQFPGTRTGSLAQSLGDAICKGEGKIFKLFVQFTKDKGEFSRVQYVFDGLNLDGKKDGERIVWPVRDYLPFQAVEIFWDSTRLTKLADLEKLAGQIRKAEELPPAAKLKPPEEKATPPKFETPPLPPKPPEPPNQSEPPPETETPPEPAPEAEPPPPPIPVAEQFPDIDVHRSMVLSFLEGGCTSHEVWASLIYAKESRFEEQRVTDYIEALLRELFPPEKINPKLFGIHDSGRVWENEAQLLPFMLGDTVDSWTVKDACQGTLILGAPGSGKTTGSGRTIAGHFLAQGFGGLILTTKQGEANDWVKFASMHQRHKDVAVICPQGYLRLNMLQYEMERPTLGVKLSDNLVHFFKNLASVIGHRASPKVNESFWQDTGDAMLQNTVDCFFLAKYPISLDNLCSFIVEAPQNEEAAKDENWRKKPVFGACLAQAEQADLRMYKILCEYWLQEFPNLPPNTRSCITIAFSSMVRALRAPHINDLLSTMTTITPESIFDGRIIILDLPVNEYHEAGLLVQAAWKYLFQRAILSRADKPAGTRCRPVFLWEDEAQNFLIDFDAKFQPVCREYRAACVKLSQNISNFYARFGGGDAARTKTDAIIGSLNTRIFHANGDNATNQWASEFIGTEYKTITNTSTTPAQYNGLNPFKEMMHRLLNQPTVTTSENTVREPSIHPHEFGSLQTGSEQNGFVTQAVVAQVGRIFAATGKNFFNILFQQTVLPITEQEKVAEEANRLKREAGYA